MKKLLLILCTLLAGVSGAWAIDVVISDRTNTVATGSVTTTNEHKYGTYLDAAGGTSFTTNATSGMEGVTVTGDEAFVRAAWFSNTNYLYCIAFNPDDTDEHTITISAPEGYVIMDYSITAISTSVNRKFTVTPAGDTKSTDNVSSSLVSFNKTSLNSQTASITIKAANNNTGNFLCFPLFSVTITEAALANSQASAYNTVKGWISTIQGAEGLVTDAANYVSNAKSSAEGSYAALLDGDYTTYFHSAYGSEGPDEDHYLQATLSEAVDAFYFYFKKRSQNQANRPTSITIYGSNDNSNFTEITTINSGFPTTSDVLDYASSKINLGASYKYIRFTVTATNTGATSSNGHVFFTFSEFYMFPSNSHIDDAMGIYLKGKKAADYTNDEITQINSIDLELRSATLAPAKANIIATYTIPDGKAGTQGYPTTDAWNTFVAAINAITIEDDFDAKRDAAINALLASAKLANGIYKIKNYNTGHYLYQDEAGGIVTFASTEGIAGNHGYWRVTDNGDGTYAILDLYGHQLTKGNQSQGWSSVQNGNRTQVTVITRDYSDANYKTTDSGLASFYLGGAHVNTGYKTGSKVFVTDWTTGGLGSNANHWLFEPVDVSELTAYTITVTGAPESITMGDGTVLENGTYTLYLSGADKILAPEITSYEVSKVVEETTATITYTATDYAALITAYLTEDKMNNIGGAGKIGYMQNTGDDFTNLMNLLLTFQDPAHVYTESDYNNLITYYEACEATFTAPSKGKFYRFKSNATNKYIGFAESGSQPMVEEAAACIYFYTNDGNILSYNKGRYLSVSTGNTASAIGAEGGVFNFYKSGYSTPTLGTCRIRDINNARGSLIDWTDGYLNGWGEGNHERCEWIVETVTTLPVSISSVGYATFFCPVAVTIPSGVKAYYISTLSETEATLTEIEGTIPASTAVVLIGSEGSYDFTIASDVEAISGNKLAGTAAAIEYIDGAYTLQTNKDNSSEVGLYPTAVDYLAGFKAYLPATAFSSEAKGFTFRFSDIETVINSISAKQNGSVFDLSGRRVSKPAAGLYIENGKKVAIK